MRTRNFFSNVFTIVVFIAVALVFLLGFVGYFHVDTVQVKVTGKERIYNSEDSYYLVFTEEETFRNADSFVFFKFNSSDLQGRLRENQVYELDVYGFRIPLLSSYRNIVDGRLAGG